MGEYLKSSIKNWSVEDRPREKILKQGIQNLSNSELMAVLIGSGTREMNAVELSRIVLASADNNLDELGKHSIESLVNIKGIGLAKAITLLAALELGSRRGRSYNPEKVAIKSSLTAYDLLHPILGDLEHEEFWLVILNRAHKVMGTKKISQGGLTGTVIDTRMILKHAIDKRATCIIVSHNHPSGNRNPSEADVSITKKLSKAAALMEITLLDHLIIADHTYFSFADEGLLL